MSHDHFDIFHVAVILDRSPCFAFLSYCVITESSELKEAAGVDQLDATVCLYKLGADKVCHRWSFMLKRERAETSIAEYSYLAGGIE